MYPNLSASISNEQQPRLNKMNKIKNYFLAEIRERKLISKNGSKYIASFEHFNKSLISLSILASSISIASYCIIEESKKIGINEVIKRNEIINNSLK